MPHRPAAGGLHAADAAGVLGRRGLDGTEVVDLGFRGQGREQHHVRERDLVDLAVPIVVARAGRGGDPHLVEGPAAAHDRADHGREVGTVALGVVVGVGVPALGRVGVVARAGDDVLGELVAELVDVAGTGQGLEAGLNALLFVQTGPDPGKLRCRAFPVLTAQGHLAGRLGPRLRGHSIKGSIGALARRARAFRGAIRARGTH